MGTPAYSAPETFGGKNFTPASDQFSLAALLYEGLRGERAFPGDDAVEVAARIAQDPPARFCADRNLPTEVDDILLRAMARAPVDRFPSCEALGELLADALAPAITPPARAMMASSSGRLPIPDTTPQAEHHERRWGQVALGASVIVATAALLVHTALRHEDDPRLTLAPSASISAEPVPSASERPRASSSPSVRAPRLRTSSDVAAQDAANAADAGTGTDGGGGTSNDGGAGQVGDGGTASNPNAPPALSATMTPAPSAPPSTPSSASARPAGTASAPTNDARRLP